MGLGEWHTAFGESHPTKAPKQKKYQPEIFFGHLHFLKKFFVENWD
jgi:hypothetical protein